MITPLEIQNHEFTSRLRGFNPEEVKHFLYAVAEEFEKLIEQNHQMAQELAVSRERIKDMESREKVLKDTLVSAQQIKADIQENAVKEADLIVKEAQLKADALRERAREDVRTTQTHLADLRRTRNDLLAEAEMMVSRFTHFVEAERDLANEADALQKLSFMPPAGREEDATQDEDEHRLVQLEKKPNNQRIRKGTGS
ncbi:DivIVA domain-containing protein [Acanthopleuribacter pedis]|uniref:DivIVA domain-containing protein n=1 Tax=Acanthopleuribacter pedis TaxID=442870 RepID=A0A8J7PY89_9BACT|nr:DivIVA domain-containing protein [Acanthopleuribacter pedis]